MNQPPQANPPLLDAETATSDVATAVRFIQQRRGRDRLCIVTWSWGTVLAARFATMHPQSVERLVLYAPVWRWHDAPVPQPPARAYRSVTREAARRGWLDAAPAGARDSLIPPGWFEQWADANWATDPEGAKAQPPVLRAPNGPLVEMIRRWNDGSTAFDPALVTVPTLLAVGEWDRTTPPYMAHELHPLLTRAREARLVDIPQGTHQVFMERQRGVLFAAVQQFLEAG